MEILIKAGQLFLALAILVGIHELGHFMAARFFKIRVDKFYLFFDAWGIKLFKLKRGETEYGIGWLPLGGYVKIAGMIDESMDKEFLDKPAETWEFRSKPVWQRLIVILGGIFMNIVLGIFIFSMFTWHYGESFIPASEMKYGIVAYPLAKEVGLQTGDKILAINGKPIARVEDLTHNPQLFLNKHLVLSINRNGQTQEITLPSDFGKKIYKQGPESFIDIRHTFTVDEIAPGTPAVKAGLKAKDKIVEADGKEIIYFDQLSEILKAHKGGEIDIKVVRNHSAEPVVLHTKIDTQGRIGFMQKPDMKTENEYYGIATSFGIGSHRAYRAVADNVIGLKRMITGDLPANSIHSFIGIANYYGPTWDWMRFWALTATLSMMLAFMNFLPIPALDGGYVIFLLIELFRGKPASYKVLEIAQMTGIGILVLLMGFAFYNDFTQFILK